MATISMALPLSSATQTRSKSNLPSSEALLKPSLKKISMLKKPEPKTKLVTIEASCLKEKAVKGLTAAMLASYMVLPEVAHAAADDFSPSLKNFLLSIAAGGVVLVAILGAVIGVANFDPVKRT